MIEFVANEMNQADEELRVTISQIWPLQANKMLDLLVPPIDQLNKNNLTVGKIYGGLLILETWRNTKFIELRNAKEVTTSIFLSHFDETPHNVFCFITENA